jgi:di/tricarboxylate transporter
MTPQAWISLAITGLCLLMLARSRWPAELVMLAAMTLLLALGIIGPSSALRGFANEGLMTIAALYVVAAALKETGAVGWIAQRLLGQTGQIWRLTLRVMLPTALLSAFVNNTPVVAMFMPAVQEWARRIRQPASRFLLPLSYASILGGTCTLIGTSTNLVVNGLLIERTDGPGLGMFDITLIGLPVLLISVVFIALCNRKLLPERASPVEQLASAREYLVRMHIPRQSPLHGRSIEKAGLRHLANCYLMDIERDGELLQAVAPQQQLQQGDHLLFIGTPEAVIELRAIKGLEPADDQVHKLSEGAQQRRLVEAVIAPGSQLAGKSIRDSRFRSHFNAVILSVSRNGARLNGKIGDLELRPGDTVLLETSKDFCLEHGNSHAFLLVHPLDLSLPAPRNFRAPLAMGILAGMVLANTLGLLSMLQAALLAAGAMLVTRCITAELARRSIDMSVLVVIGASFALGNALTETGAAQAIADFLLSDIRNPLLGLMIIYVLTTLFTEVVTNNAAAVIMFPIAMAMAEHLGVSGMPFVIAIMFAASASFMTPIGYQTNLMVYGPGGYHFSDYLRIGVPLNLLVGLVTLTLIPQLFPFN